MKTTLNTTPTNAAQPPTLIERLDRFTTAWNAFAAEQRFANKTWSEFISATSPSRDIRAALADRQAHVKGGISNRNSADKATRALIKRVVGGVIADAAYGPDCALYRAMGFTPESERKTGAQVVAAGKPAKAPNVGLMERYQKVVSAWTEFAPDSSFAGMTLRAFKEAAAKSLSARSALESMKTNCKGSISMRDAADAVTLDLMSRVVSSIKAEEGFGDDCPLYRALGYTPASERRSPRRAVSSAPVAATSAV